MNHLACLSHFDMPWWYSCNLCGPLRYCADYDLGQGFFHGAQYVAVVWIFSEHSVGNRCIFVLAGHYLHRSKASSAHCATPLVRRLELHKKLGEDAGPVTPSDKGDIPNHVTPCSVRGGKKEGGQTFRAWYSSQVTITRWGLVLLAMVEHLSALGRRWMDSLFCFARVLNFCFPY